MNLKIKSVICFLSIVGLTVPGLLPQNSAHAVETTGAIRIAVVDVREVRRNTDKWINFQNELQVRRQNAEDILLEYQNRLSRLEMEYENLPPGSERAEEKQREIQVFWEQFQQKEQELLQQYQAHGVEGYRRIFAVFNDVVSSYAMDNNIDLVLKKQRADLSATSLEELEIFDTADVLYAAPELDISVDIVRLLNEKYAEED